MDDEPHRVPIVEAGPLERAIVDRETEWFDQVQRAAGRGAQTRDVAGIGRDLRFDEHDVQRRIADVVRRHEALLGLHRHAFAQRTRSSLRAGGATSNATPP